MFFLELLRISEYLLTQQQEVTQKARKTQKVLLTQFSRRVEVGIHLNQIVKDCTRNATQKYSFQIFYNMIEKRIYKIYEISRSGRTKR